jgi:shikimate kinase
METIILIGPKHSGKTKVGKALASLCSCEFVDLDDIISQREGKTPRQLFNEGQAVFQKAEAEAVAALFGANAEGQRVIAAGGGIIDNAEAVSVLKKSGAITVDLNISAGSAWDRIASASDGELPPFLQTENPRETHRTLHERRSLDYLRLSDIIINTEGKTPDEIAKEIVQLLGIFVFPTYPLNRTAWQLDYRRVS